MKKEYEAVFVLSCFLYNPSSILLNVFRNFVEMYIVIIKKLLSKKGIFSKGYTEKWSKEIFVIDSVLKTDPWTFDIKDLHGRKL